MDNRLNPQANILHDHPNTDSVTSVLAALMLVAISVPFWSWPW